MMSAIQRLEIVDMEEDRPVQPGQAGRLLFTSSAREYPRVVRYEIGDTGRWLEGPCACGRADPRFELQGRMGDVFKAGAPFFNARKFATILDERLGYAGPVQIHLREEGPTTVLDVWISGEADAAAAERAIREGYEEVAFSERTGLAFRFAVRAVEAEAFVRVAASGKLKPICDHRSN